MESKKLSVYISLLIIIIASIIVNIDLSCIQINNIHLLLIKNKETIDNLCIGIIGSALVTLIIYFTEYSVERKKALENYYLEATKIVRAFETIKYVEITPKNIQLSKYLMRDTKERLNDDNIKILIPYYDNNNLLSGYPVELSEEQKIILIRKDIKNFKKEVIEAIESYINFSKISFELVEMAYGNISFFFERIKTILKYKSLKIKIYDDIHIQLRSMIENIYFEKSYFEIYKEGKTNNFYMVVDRIKKLNEQLFEIETKNIENYEYIYVYEKFVNNMIVELENLRAKIYHERPVEQKRVNIISYFRQINTNLESDKNEKI